MRFSLTFLLATLLLTAGASASQASVDMKRQPAFRSAYAAEGLYVGGSTCNTIERYLRVLNPELIQGEPAILEILLRRPVTGQVDEAEFSARLQVGLDLRIFVQPPRGPQFEFRPAQVNPLAPTTVVPLRPGEFFSFHVPLAFDPESVSGALFEEPGTYRVMVRLACRDSHTPRSDTETGDLGMVEITVREPDNDADRTAVGFIRDHEFFRSFQNQRPQRPEDRALMERIVTEAPGSRYAPFALFALANTRLTLEPAEGNADEATMEREHRTRIERSIMLIRKMREEYPDHPLTQSAQLRLIRLALAIGDERRAREYFLEAWQDPRLTHQLLPHGPEMKWIFGDGAANREEIGGEWMVFLDPRHGMDESIYLDPPQTQEQMFREALMEAIREGRVEVRRADGPPPTQ